MSTILYKYEEVSKILKTLEVLEASQILDFKDMFEQVKQYMQKHDNECNYNNSYYINYSILGKRIMRANCLDFLNSYDGRHIAQLKKSVPKNYKYIRTGQYLNSNDLIYKNENIEKLSIFVQKLKQLNYNLLDEGLSELLNSIVINLQDYIVYSIYNKTM